MTKNTSSNTKDSLIVHGARVNNLKNINISIPRNKLVVITGLSGSGKSSLAFDAIFAEGNRRYLEGMSSFARLFLDVASKPDVDKIENLSPTIAIDQKSLSRNPRSTVGTITEIYDYLRILLAKVGIPFCPHCHQPMKKISNQEIIEELKDFSQNTQVIILAKRKGERKEKKELLKNISQLGYARVRINKKVMLLEEAINEVEDENESVEVVVDRIIIKENKFDRERIIDSLETAFKLGNGSIIISIDNQEDKLYNRDFICQQCDFKLGEITPKHFSFNNPEGACSHCSGLGIIKEIAEELLMPNLKLTLAEGAIISWSKSGGKGSSGSNWLNTWEDLGRKYGFSIHMPLRNISAEQRKIILYGENSSEGKRGYEGVIPLLMKRYEEGKLVNNRNEIEKYMVEKTCPVCQGRRLKEKYLSVLVGEKSIDQIAQLNLKNFLDFMQNLRKIFKGTSQEEIVASLAKEMIDRAQALVKVGLEYISIDRSANSISGGEGQRIRLAVQSHSELMGLIYILDEPSIGLHNRDTEKLIEAMKELKKAGNSLIVVEHDEEIMRNADWIIDMGPGAGEEGGEVIFEGTIKKLLSSKTSTAQYLSGKKKVTNKKKYRSGNNKFLEITGAKTHNLRDIDVSIPLNKFVTVTGVSGSGKSTLICDILSKALARHFWNTKDIPGEHKKIKGLNYIDKVITIDQTPIGRTPRSNAATYTGVFSLIRELFSQTEEAKRRGYSASQFSFNMKGGRCEDCQGEGTKKIEMHLLPDMYVKCETCLGTRYNRKTLDIEHQGVNISEVLEMSVSYAKQFFKKHYLILEKLKTLEEVGLGYLKLGQSATNLSGGEAQRIKLATELARKSTGKTLYILDEPTIGLHFEDIKKLLNVLDALVDKGNTVLVIEHNKEVIKNSDWVIDLGPEGGEKGGEVVYAGLPSGLKKCKRSWTGKYL